MNLKNISFLRLSNTLTHLTSPMMTPVLYASAYERMTSNCTKQIAEHMLSNISPAIDPKNSYILDNACGPGIVTSVIKERYPEARILAADLNPGMIEEVQKRITTHKWTYVETAVLDSRDLEGIRDGTFSHAFLNLGSMGPEDPDGLRKTVAEIFRVLKVGGVAMISIWADRVWPAAFLRTARSIRPGEDPHNPTALPLEYMSASWLVAQLERGGFGNNIAVAPCETAASASTLDELSENMMLAKGMFFPGYSEVEIEKARKVLYEELRNCRSFVEIEGSGVKIGMKAFIGVGWKRGDERMAPI